MEDAEPVTKFEQVLVVDGEQRALQRGKHRQLIVRPLDGGQSRAHGFDLFAAVKRLAADEQMRDPARFDGVDVRAGHVFAEARRTGGTGWRCGAAGVGTRFSCAVGLPLGHGPAAVFARSATR